MRKSIKIGDEKFLSRRILNAVVRNFNSEKKPLVKFMHDEVGHVESLTLVGENLVADVELNQQIPADFRSSLELLGTHRGCSLVKVQLLRTPRWANA